MVHRGVRPEQEHVGRRRQRSPLAGIEIWISRQKVRVRRQSGASHDATVGGLVSAHVGRRQLLDVEPVELLLRRRVRRRRHDVRRHRRLTEAERRRRRGCRHGRRSH